MSADESQKMAVATLAPQDFADRLVAHLPRDCVEELIDALETQDFCVIPEPLASAMLARQREALAPWIEQGTTVRDVCESAPTHRVYAMLAKDPIFAELLAHPFAGVGRALSRRELPAVGLPGHLFGAGRVGVALA